MSTCVPLVVPPLGVPSSNLAWWSWEVRPKMSTAAPVFTSQTWKRPKCQAVNDQSAVEYEVSIAIDRCPQPGTTPSRDELGDVRGAPTSPRWRPPDPGMEAEPGQITGEAVL